MRPIALIPLIFLAITYSANAASQSYQQSASPSYQKYPTTPPETHFQGTCDSDPDGTKFADKACYTSFKNPGETVFAPRYRPPTCDKSRPLTQEQKSILAKAYSRAPDYMKGKLCRLTKVFVTGSQSWGPMGWGLWEGPDRLPGSKSVYVAISDRQLTGRSSFVDVENQTNRDLLRAGYHGKGKYHAKGSGLVQLKGAAPDPELAVLAELAHELGHALVADANMDGVNPRHPRRRVSGPPQNACYETAFLPSWEEKLVNKRLRRWVDFGEQYGNRTKNDDLKFSLDHLRYQVRRGNFDAANRLIRGAYSSNEFVSFASMITIQEDIVELYKYKVLADVMGSQKGGFDVNGQPINVFDNLNSGVLKKKVQCLSDLGFLSGGP
jgi:hypothetical protein